jgi:colicin import membrane protein
MPPKLKTYQTSLGFFDLAIAAPSMKAALESWGSTANLFHQGFAKEANDPAIIAATMARPGVVLRRAVGSNASFGDHADLPKDLTTNEANGPREKRVPKSPAAPRPRRDDRATREAAAAYAREQKRLDHERRTQEAAQEAERERRSQAIAKAQAALGEAKRTHDKKTAEIASARNALDRRSEAEEARWDTQRAKLEAALNHARK